MKAYQTFATKNAEEALGELGSSAAGLSAEEAASRLGKYGRNEIRAREMRPMELFVRQFWTPLTWLLLAAAAVALTLGEVADAITILVIVSINTVLGFVQEFRSEAAVRRLRSFITARTSVIRGGTTMRIEREEIVPGDIVPLAPGDMAPADLRIIAAEGAQVDESVLTGESVPAAKQTEPLSAIPEDPPAAKNIVFSGTTLVSGSLRGVAAATGGQTEFGGIAALTAGARRKSAFEESLAAFSRFVLRLVIVTLAIVFVANLLIEGPSAKPAELLLFALALAVSVVPEALPAVMTVTFSRGALHLARKHVVVKRLSAIEDLGHIEVLCTDKTGTITENRLTVSRIVAGDVGACLRWALASVGPWNGGKEPGNPFDRAVWEKAKSEKLTMQNGKFNIIHELPFDHARRRSAVVVRADGERMLIVKGAPEGILERSATDAGEKLTEARRQRILSEFRSLGKAGMRVLAVAVRPAGRIKHLREADERDLDFQGLIGFEDPLKPTARNAVAVAEKLRVRVKILTGDSPDVAGVVAHEIGIVDHPGDVVTGAELERLARGDFERAVREHDVFARVTPEMKYRIIEALQRTAAVGFLGEGLNDAPALKLATVALAVDSASDIAKDAADAILLDKSLAVIVDGIREGRTIVANVAKYIRYTMAGNIGNFYSIAAVSLFLPFLPMLPVQILLVNLLTDLPLITVATDTVDPSELDAPRRLNIRDIAFSSLFLGSVSALFDLTFFGIFRNAPEPVLQTLWFIESITEEIAVIYVFRTRLAAFRASRPSGTLVVFTAVAAVLAVAIPFTVAGQATFHFVRPPIAGLWIILALVVASFFTTDFVKRAFIRVSGRM